MLFRALDVETTGIPTDDDPHAVCEVGWVDLQMPSGLIGVTSAVLTQPGRPMPPEARAVHHISDADIAAGAIRITDAFQMLAAGKPSYFCAHNCAFEQKFFGGGETPWLCTYKAALRIWPDAPSHSLQVLRYWLDLDVEHDRCMPPHRAGPDAYACAGLLLRILRTGIAVDEILKWTSGPALLPKITFGKHAGKRWEDVPTDYLQWMLGQQSMDRDARANARHHLKLRGANG